jgi:fructokinase
MKLARFGAVEAGGTNVICMVGSDPDHIVARTRIPTGRPTETLAEVFAFFQHEVSVGGPLAAIGIASFGPLELRRSHPRYGFIRKTPKPGWSDVDMVGLARSTLGVPVGFDTDVNAAALAEGRWGAARDLKTFVYMTVGTGIGVGAVVEGRILHGLGHPEMGHLSVPRHSGDDFAGHCPFHGDCLEEWPVVQRSPPAGAVQPSNSTATSSGQPSNSRPPTSPPGCATSSTRSHRNG